MPPAIPIIVGGALAAGGSIASAAIGSKAAGDAAEAQGRASQQEIEERRRQFEVLQKTLAPYVQAGSGALAEMQDLLGLGADRQVLQFQGRDATAAEIERYSKLQSDVGRGPNNVLRDIFGTNISAEQYSEANRALQAAGLSGAQAQQRYNELKQQQESLMGGDWGDQAEAMRMQGKVDEAKKLADYQKTIGDYEMRAQQAEQAKPDLSEYSYRTDSAADRQKAQIAAIENSTQFAAMARQGETGILQNASATGGLRGGNTQAALAQFRPQLLQQLIDQRFARLAGIAGMGQASAAGVGAGAMQTAQGVGGAYQAAGQAQAQGALASGAAWSQPFGTLSGLGGYAMGRGIDRVFSPSDASNSDVNKVPTGYNPSNATIPLKYTP